MNVNALKKDELQYELAIRGIDTKDQTVEQMRTCLRPLFRIEKLDASLHYPDYTLNPAEEIEIVSAKLPELTDLVQQFPGDKKDSAYERIQSRLMHLLSRIDRIPTEGEAITAGMKEERSTLVQRTLKLMDDLEQSAEKSHKQPADISVILRNQSLPPEPEVPERNISTPIQTTPRMESNYFKRQPIQKWNLKFSGENKHLSVHDFLERVEELRLARHCSQAELFDSAIDLFEGKALLWYRSNRQRVNDWEGLAELLRRHYEPPDYKSRLFKDIMARTQGPDESIVEYMTCMNAMCKRYGSIPEDVQVDILSRNLAPFYTMQLPPVNSLAQLEEECLKLEVKKFRADSYMPPSRKQHSYVEPNFAFVSCPSTSSDVESLSAQVARVNVSAHTGIKCWNCNELGHPHHRCTKPRKMFCYRCGKVDVTTRNCPSCSHSGNADRRS